LSSSGGNGAVIFFNCSELIIFSLKSCKFMNISSSLNGTLFINSTSNSLNQYSSKFNINNCTFKYCSSLYGGALYFVNVYLFIYLFIYLFLLIKYINVYIVDSVNCYKMYIRTKCLYWYKWR
jgi:hypothetical protein